MPARPGTEWDSDQCFMLQAGWRAMHTPEEIAARIERELGVKRSPQAILSKARDMKLPPRGSAKRRAPINTARGTAEPSLAKARAATAEAKAAPKAEPWRPREAPKPIRHRECQWMAGDRGSYHACGKPRAEGSRLPYCCEHVELARAKPGDCLKGEAA